MPTVAIAIDKGINKSVDSFELGSSGFASEFRNLLIDSAGHNVDRPALGTFASLGADPVNGLYAYSSSLVAITQNGRRIFSISSTGVVTDITGTALESTNRPVFAEDGDFLAIAGGGAPRRWDGSGDTDLLAGSPEDCTHISYLDGYWIAHLLNDQEFRFAGPTAAARLTWSAGDFFQAEALPDNLVAHAVLLKELYGFGASSTEIYQNFGDSDVPFRPTFFMDWGCKAPYSIVKANNTLFWLAQDSQGDRQFVMMQGRTPVVIGTPFDRVLQGLSTVSDCWGTRIDINGFHLIAWTFPTEGLTWVFDYQKQSWSEWAGYSNGSLSAFKMHSYAYSKTWNRHFVGDATTGKVWELSLESKADGADPLVRVRRTGDIDHGTGKRKRNNWYEFNVKRGLGTSGGTEPKMLVRFKDDDKEWSAYREIPLGFSGNRATVYRLYRTGIYRKRQIEVSMTDAYEFNLGGIQEDVDVLAS